MVKAHFYNNKWIRFGKDLYLAFIIGTILIGSSLVGLADYSAEVIKDEPVAYWRLDDEQSPVRDSTENDYSAFENNGINYSEESPFLNDDNSAISFLQNGQLITDPFEKIDGAKLNLEKAQKLQVYLGVAHEKKRKSFSIFLIYSRSSYS